MRNLPVSGNVYSGMKLRLLTLSTLAMSVAGAHAQSLDQQVNTWLEKSKVPGASIGVMKDGKVRLLKGYGYANLETRTKMTADSVHELASVSKQFVATAILKLNQEGLLKLDDPINEYLPTTDPAWQPITIRHLLHHTSGVPDYLESLGTIRNDANKTTILKAVAGKPLRFAPGSKFEYSNTGYTMLGYIVEKASGKSLRTYLSEKLWQPTGMNTTRFNTVREVVPNRASGYTEFMGRLQVEDYTSESLSQTGDGCVMSTARDLLKWDQALRTNLILDAKHTEMLFTPDPSSKSYACGWMVFETPEGRVATHSGGWMGTTTNFTRHLTKRDALVVLVNRDNVDLRGLEAIITKNFQSKGPATANSGTN